MKKINRRSWYMMPMPDTFIYRFNILEQYQPDLLVFAYRKGWIIGDSDVDPTGVDRGGDENEVPI